MSASPAASAALRRRLARNAGPHHDADLREAPLSYIQEAIWLLDRLSGGTDATVQRPCVLTLPSTWSRDQIADALAMVIQQHHGLRSTFPIVDGSPRQVLQDPFVPEVRQPPAGPADRWEETVAARAAEMTSRLAPIGDRPPLSSGVELVSGPQDRNALVLPCHHVMFDGLSEQLLCAALGDALAGQERGGPWAGLPTPSLQPADWAIWQRAHRPRQSLQESLDWWVERLDGLRRRPLDAGHAVTGPVTDQQSTDQQLPEQQVIEQQVLLDRSTVDRMVEIGRDQDASLFAVLLHTLGRAVEELIGHEHLGNGRPSGGELAVAVPVSGRSSASVEQVIGCFINMVIVRPGRSIGSARDDLLAALDHQEVPYAWVVNQLLPGAGRRRGLVDIAMQLRNFGLGGDERPGSMVRPWPRHLGTPSRPVDVIATPNADGLAIEVRGSGGRYGADFVERLAETMASSARQLADGPSSKTRTTPSSKRPSRPPSKTPTPQVRSSVEVEVPTSGEPTASAGGWIGASSPSLPPPPALHRRPLLERIQGWVESGPDRVAVRWTGMTLRRDELWLRAGQLADLLALAGVGRADVVAIVGQRCPGIVVAQLAVMRLGAVMVLVDPAFPRAHKIHVVDSASARTVIDLGGEHWDADDGRRLPVDLLGLASATGPSRTNDGGLDVAQDDPAYIVFTSGSTGRPKGIVGTHRTWGHLADWAIEHGGLTEDDRVGFNVGISFDVMFRSTVVPLAAGAEVVISADPLSPVRALRWVAEEQLTVVALTPTMARTWASQADPDLRLERLRSAWFCGELLTSDVLAAWESATGGTGSALNLYGPSETGSFKVFGPARPAPVGPRVAVGRPVAETEVLLVDAGNRPVPQGSHGEILIRTRGGTAGYLDEADAEGRFIPNPWRDDETDIVYRTGDTGYLDRSGDLVIVGRIDDQVQVGGFRVEPIGTAAVIEQLDEVRHCVVEMVHSKADGQLVAYVVPRPGTTIDEAAVIGHATDNLPRPAVPARVVTLDRLPLTPSGKLNRRALPQPTLPANGEPPRTPSEIALARIWGDVLDLDSIGRDDDFVVLGGTSLSALIVVDRIAAEFGVELSFNDLVDRWTLVEVAALIDESTPAEAAVSGELSAPAEAVERPNSADRGLPRHPLTPLQAGMWFEQQLDPTSDAYNIPMVHHLRGPLDVDALEAAFRVVVAGHEPLRTVINLEHGEPVAEVLDATGPGIRFVDLAGVEPDRREADAMELAAEVANQPFDLTRPPLRVTLIRVAADHHVLAVVVHHVAFDGASKRVLLSWLEAAYAAACRGAVADLSPPTVPYRERPVVADTSSPDPGTVERRVAALSPVPSPPSWPARAGAVDDEPTATIRIDVGPGLSDGLTAAGRRLRATRAAVGLAAHVAFVHSVTGAEAVLVAVPASLRRPSDEDVIGLFVNTLIIRAEPKPSQSFADLVNEVRLQLAAAFDSRSLPFDRLARALRVRAGAGRSPVTTAFQLGEADTSPEPVLAGLVTERLPTRLGASKFPVVASIGARRGEYRLRVAPEVGDEKTAAALAERGAAILRAALADPTLALSELAAGEAEPDGCRQAVDRPQSPHASEPWLARIAESLRQDPQRQSLGWHGGSWSRSQLWAAAGAVAAALEQAGCGPDSRVALLTRRSPQLIASMLGIRMVGGAWIALDLDQPDARLRSIIDRVAPDAVIADPVDHRRLGLTAPLVTPSVADPDVALRAPIEPADSRPNGQIAYLIATSGSTGVPHIVAVPSTALDAFVDAAIERYQLTPADRVLQFHSPAFDASVEEIGPALAAGAAVELAPADPLSSTQGYVRDLDDRRITVASMPTRLWQQLVDDLVDRRTPAPAGLRLMIIGGERAKAATVGAWNRAVGSGITLLNSYGPTEATVVTHVADLTGWTGGEGDPVSIGHPMGHNVERIGGSSEGSGPGRQGELWLGGPQLASGYLDEPAVTRSRFVTVGGQRWFRTGDLVRRLEDGSLTFIGRLDDQVKIRGHRVELAEVAEAIERHPSVSAAAVLAEEANGDTRLVAHVEAEAGADVDRIRTHLRKILPDHLLPGRIIIGAKLARTPGGKVDRAALRADESGPVADPLATTPARPATTPTPPATTPVAPATTSAPPSQEGPAGAGSALPAELTAIWKEVLDVDRAEPDDDFFELGGHSLLAVKLASLLEEAFGREIPLMVLVETPTLGAIADHLGFDLVAPIRPARPAGPPPEPPRAEPPGDAPSGDEPPGDAPSGDEPSKDAPSGDEPPKDAPPRSEQPCDARPTPTSTAVAAPPRRLHLDRGPLSSSQRRLWFLQQLDRDSSAYHIPVVLELRGRVDLAALAGAIQATATRHEALRTRFVTDAGTVLQVVDGTPQVTLERHDVDPADGPAGVDDALAANVRRAFRLDHDHPFRATLFTVGPGHAVLQLILHHVAVDGASVPIILADIADAYRRAVAGDGHPNRYTGLQQLDVAIDEHAGRAEGRLADAEQWWRTQLADLPGPLELPQSADRQAPARADLELDATTTGQLLALAEQHRASITAIVLAMTAAALGRLTGRRDVVIGLPATQRGGRTEDVVGCFVNTLPIRCRLADDMTMGQLIDQVRRSVVEALDHRHHPVDQLVGSEGGRRDPGRPDLLQVVCNVSAASTRSSDFELPGILVSRRHRGRAAVDAKFELSVTGGLVDGRLRLRVVTDRPLTGRGGTRVISEAMEAMAKAGDQPIADVAITTEAARRWLVADLNPAAGREAPTVRVDELVSRWVDRSPDAIAIVDGPLRCTYRQLWADAEVAARRLDEAGVAVGDRVVVIADRSIAQVVWSLAALLRRAVYVPVDPGGPRLRIEQLIEDCDPAAVVRLEGHESSVVERPERRLPPCRPDTAYIMYTSGSTGIAKGVVIPHRAIVRLVDEVGYVELGPDTVMAHLSNPAFDAATFEVWGALCCGGRLVVIPRPEAADPARLEAALEEHRVSTMFLTTALFNAMVGSRPEVLGRLDQLLFGGEAVDANAVATLMATSPPGRLLHVYGPTETTTFATFHPIDASSMSAATIPIGLPIDATTVDVIDRWGEPCPPGVVGEVVIGGPGVALEYFDEPELTGRRFVPDPIRGAGVGMVFLTGDLARRGDGGELEFVGRRDRQVKLRGFRLELGAIESVLTGHPLVDDAALVIVGEGSRRRLAGAVVGRDGFEVRALEAWAAQRLAEHERPWRLIAVDRLPVTANGKVDRSAVGSLIDGSEQPDQPDDPAEPIEPTDAADLGKPAELGAPAAAADLGEPAEPVAAANRDPVRPRRMVDPTHRERMLGVWRTVMGRGDLALDEEFFEAGGHSLLAIELMDAVELEFGAELFVSDIFECPTAAALADRVASGETASGGERADGVGSAPDPATISDASDTADKGDIRLHRQPADPRVLVEMRQGTGNPVFLFHGGGGDVVGYANLAWQINDGIPVVGVRAPGLLASGTIDRTIDDMLDRYLPAIVARNGDGSFRLCGHSFGGILAYAAATRLTSQGHEVEFVGLLDALFPRDHGGSARRLLHKFERAAGKGRSEVVAASRKFLRHRYQRARVEFRVAGHRTSNQPVPVRLARRRLKMRSVMAASTFQPAPFDGPVVFFKAMGNRKVGSDGAEKRWRLVAPNLVVCEVQGRHTGPGSILTEHNVSVIADEINRRLRP